MTPFDIIKNINNKTGNIFDKDFEAEKNYNSVIINKNFSFDPQTVLCANTLNGMHYLDKKMQYDYLYACVKKKNRYTKWIKSNEVENQDLVMDYYKINRDRAKEYLSIMDEEDIEILKTKTFTGGDKTSKK
jgi:hypothetical protein